MLQKMTTRYINRLKKSFVERNLVIRITSSECPAYIEI